jgi:regulation of enolase protein 1 (concanavalin A-like superfamily)
MKSQSKLHSLRIPTVAALLLISPGLHAQTVPELMSAVGVGNNVQVVFSVPVQAAGATNPANYWVTNLYGRVDVLGAAMGTNDHTVQLTTGKQLPFMVHWLGAVDVFDALTGTNAVAPSQITFRNVAFTTGYSMTDIYRGITGTSISDLTNNANFPAHPTQTYYSPYSYWSDSAVGANYGGRMSGILVPPVSGDYQFEFYSFQGYNASCLLSLSANEDPALRTPVADRLNASGPVTLVAGQHYYYEALFKEGASASDFVYFEWKLPGSDSWSVLWGDALGNYLAPAGASITITQQPVDVSIYDGRQATFNAAATHNSKIVTDPNYQWQIDGVDIPGATQSSYTTPILSVTNNGTAFRVLVVIPGAAVFSRDARLAVTRDLEPPTVLRALCLDASTVQLQFSEPVEPVSALNPTNYSFVNGTRVNRASLDDAATTVTLFTENLVYGSNYSIVVNGVRDRALEPNTILTNTIVNLSVNRPLSKDIGNAATASSITESDNGLNIVAAGSDIGGTSDQFTFSYRLCSGDFDLQVRVAGLSFGDLWAKAGLMARETLDPGSAFAATLATPSMNGAFFESRQSRNGPVTSAGGVQVNYPDTWLRLQRYGSYFIGYASYDGQTWQMLGSASLSVSNLVYVGLAVSSHSTAQTVVSQFRDWGSVGTNAVEGTISIPREALGPCSRKTPIVISEIMYKPASRTDGANLEFIELYNSNPWFHDIGGYRVVGDSMNYTVPPGTSIAGGSFLMLAASPGAMQDVYGVTNVLGPYTGSLKTSGTIQLLDEHGAVLLTIPYSNLPPWPVAADGTGHSMILANPTYGEADPRAWDISDTMGGSPGMGDSFHDSPLRDVVINELLAHTEDPNLEDFVELFNCGGRTNDLAGCVLTDDAATNKFIIPAGAVIPPGGFLAFRQSQLGFGLKAEGETVFFIDPSHSRVLDAVHFEAQADGVSFGRWPDGAKEFYPLNSRTPGTNNSSMFIGEIVINELMYHPISENDDDQFIELYNRGIYTLSLAGWQFTSGITFTFPTNASLAPGGYLVVARNRTNLFAKYPNLNAGNTVGDFSGKLSHNGERVALAMPQSLNGSKTIYVVEDEVTYGTGGRWGQWSSGGGSSLELIDPHSNHRLAANWADSDDTAKSAWVTIENTGVLDNGSTYGSAFSYAQLGQLDPGECLVDDVEVRLGTAGANLVKNPGFESGLTNWWLQGCMCRSSLENSGYAGAHSLHVRCSSRVWTGVNSCQAALNSGGLASGQTATLRFKARWLHGSPEVLLRLKGNWLEAVGTMAVPTNLGTPGAANSRAVANAGPAIYDVTHTPAVPSYGDQVVVTARVDDPDGVTNVTFHVRSDADSSYQEVPMTDDGTGGDARPRDGVFSATLPSQFYYGIAAFYVSAVDGRGVATRFPALLNDMAPPRECLVRFGDDNPGGSFGVYHYWISQTNLDRWSQLPNLSNESHDGTFVNGRRVIYNMQGRYVCSPYHQNYYEPDYDLCHFKWTFPDDDKFLGATSFDKIHMPGNGAGDDDSLQREQTAYTFMRALGVPWLNRRYAALYVNGNRNFPLIEDTQCPDGDMVKEYFPNDDNGYLYKLQPWFEFEALPTGSYANYNNESWCAILPYTTVTSAGRVKKVARYRYTFETRRTPASMNNFSDVFALIDAAASSGQDYVANVESLADMENWMRVFAANHAAGNWDSFGTQNAQNLYAYFGTQGTKCSLMMFDFNIVLGNSGSWGPGQNLFAASDSNLSRMYSNPTFRRMYLRALLELVNGPLNVTNSGPLIDAKYNAFAANGLSVSKSTVISIKSWLNSARSSISSQISGPVNSAFTVNPSVTVSNNVAYITGTAPVGIEAIRANGVSWPLTWTAVTAWSIAVPLKPGANALTVTGVDKFGQQVPGATATVVADYDGTAPAPVGQVVINEIMWNPVTPGTQYVELYNTSSNIAFDLSGWQLQGVGYTFPAGALIAPKTFLVLAANRAAFASKYGATIRLFDTFSSPLAGGGQTLALVQPDNDGTSNTIAQVRFEAGAPWPAGANGQGSSLQLIDPQQDNWRVGNWASSPLPAAFTPGASNNVQTSLPAFPSVWINELEADNLSGITNRAGQRTPWLELYNPGADTISLAGLHLAKDYNDLTDWAFPPDATLGPREFKVIFADGQTNLSTASELHTSFILDSLRGDLALSLLDTNGVPRIMDYVSYDNLAANHGFGSYPDGQSFSREPFYYATPGAPNSQASGLSVAINEWMAGNTVTIRNTLTGKYDDWFELYNYGTNAVELAGYYLTHSLTNKFEFLIPAGYRIPPGGFLLVWADKQVASGTSDLHVNFKLSKSGTSIGLFDPNGAPVDYVTFGPQVSDVSMGRYPDGSAEVYTMTLPTPRAYNYWRNTAPALAAITNRVVLLGETVSVACTAQDPDVPPQSLTFSLGAGAPAGATVTPNTGEFRWKTDVAPSTNVVTLVVADSGSPSLSASRTFTVTVLPVPGLLDLRAHGNQLEFATPSLAGRFYQLEYKSDPAAPNWIALGDAVAGTGAPLNMSVQIDLSTNGFFRVRIINPMD